MKKVTSFIYLTFGIVSLALGVVGIFVPLLPTVPFLLLAAYFFARSSPSLHDWLINHKQLGKIIKEWRENRTIPRRAKISALAMIAFSAFVIYFTVNEPFIKIVALSILIIPTVIVSRLKARAATNE